MRRFISLLITGFLTLGALTSCNLDKDLECTFLFDATVSIQDEDVQKEMEEYMDEHYVKKGHLPVYYGKYYDAEKQFIEYFIQTIKEADSDFIQSKLTQPDDAIVLQGLMSSEMGRTWIGTRTWTYRAPNEEQ